MAMPDDDDELQQQHDTEAFERAFERPPPKRSARAAPAEEADDDEDEGETAPATKAEAPRDPNRDERGRFRSKRGGDQEGEDEGEGGGDREAIPAWRLREIAVERNQLRQHAAALQRERDEYAARVAAYERQQRDLQRQQSRPDFLSDPRGYHDWLEQERATMREELRAERRNERINERFEVLREKDPQRFDNAFATLCRAGEAGDPVFERVRQSTRPDVALMKWYGELEVLHEIGGDLNGWRQKERERLLTDGEFRKAAMQAWRDQANGDDRDYRSSGNVRNLPSLNRVIGSGNQPDNDERDDESSFHRAFDPKPTRRRRG